MGNFFGNVTNPFLFTLMGAQAVQDICCLCRCGVSLVAAVADFSTFLAFFTAALFVTFHCCLLADFLWTGLFLLSTVLTVLHCAVSIKYSTIKY